MLLELVWMSARFTIGEVAEKVGMPVISDAWAPEFVIPVELVGSIYMWYHLLALVNPEFKPVIVCAATLILRPPL